MGTSNVKSAPHRRGSGGGDRNGGGDDHGEEALEETSEKVHRILRTVLPLLPNGPAKTPIYLAGAYGAYFAYQWQKRGLEHALRETGRRAAKEYLIPQAVNYSWNHISARMEPTPLTGFAEAAYKKTMTQILAMGAGVLADYKRTKES